MLSKRFPTIAVFFLALPGVVLGFGLGEIRGGSYLNEPFRAEIELVGVKAEEIDSIQAKLATEKEFQKAGALRVHFLNQLKFQPQALPSGRLVISVTSDEAIREPFVEFLVEVNWPKGRIVKEYTLLLDPPVALPGIGPPRPLPARVPTPVPPATVAQPTHIPSSPRAGAASPPPDTVTPLAYGPVRRGEHLWGIAKRLEIPGATHQEVLKALFRANPEAFYRGNINRLKVGAWLRLGPDEIGEIETTQPLSEGAPKSSLGREADEGAVRQRPAGDAPQERLRIAPALPMGGNLKPPAGEEGAGGLGMVHRDLSLMREETETVRQETSHLQQRVVDLEGQLQDIHHLLEIRNAQISQLQRDLLGGDMPASQGAVVGEPAGSSQTHLSGAVMTGGGESKSPDAAVPISSAPEQPLGLPPEAGWLAALGDLDFLPLSIGAVAALLLLITYGIRHRQGHIPKAVLATDTLAQPPALTARAPRDSFERLPPAAMREGLAVTSPAAPQDALSVEGGAVEEAGLLLGLGRYRQAEQLVRSALALEPHRVGLKVKLAEILHRTRNPSAFASLLGELEDSQEVALPLDTAEWLSAMAADLGLRPHPHPIPSPQGAPPAYPSPRFLDESSTPLAETKGPTPPPLTPPEPSSLVSLIRPAEDPDGAALAPQPPEPTLDLDLHTLLEELEQQEPHPGPGSDRGFSAAASPRASGLAEPTTGGLTAWDPAPSAAGVQVLQPGQGGRENSAQQPTANQEDRQEVPRAQNNTIKLDLARAFLAVDDVTSARGMLDEVLIDGEGATREEAERLLASLSEGAQGDPLLSGTPEAVSERE